MKSQHIPIKRLRTTPIGSTVTLPNVKPQGLYLGEFDEDGYACLWTSKDAYGLGHRWQVMATGSHPVEVSQ